jgi:hypothetical protein
LTAGFFTTAFFAALAGFLDAFLAITRTPLMDPYTKEKWPGVGPAICIWVTRRVG